MANDTTNNPIIIDTTDTTVTNARHIRGFAWTSVEGNLITGTSDLVIRHDNSSGTIIWRVRPASDPNMLQVQFGGVGYFVDGDIHVTIDAGVLHIYTC